MRVIGGLYIGFGAVNSAIDLMIFFKNFGKMGIFQLHLVHLLRLSREFFGQFMGGIGHGLAPSLIILPQA
jgi:hypothetical protein